MASGFSKRAGFNKLLYIIDGKPMARHILDTLRCIPFHRVVVVTRFPELACMGRRAWLYTRLERRGGGRAGQFSPAWVFQLRRIVMRICFFLPTSRILQPVLSVLLLKNLNAGAIVSSFLCTMGRRGSPVIFPSRLAGALGALTGDTGGRSVIAGEEHVVLLDAGDAHQGQDYDIFDTE